MRWTTDKKAGDDSIATEFDASAWSPAATCAVVGAVAAGAIAVAEHSARSWPWLLVIAFFSLLAAAASGAATRWPGQVSK